MLQMWSIRPYEKLMSTIGWCANMQRGPNTQQNNASTWAHPTDTQRRKVEPRVTFNVTCYQCGMQGHMRNECPQRPASHNNASGPKPKRVYRCQDAQNSAARERMNKCIIDGNVESKRVKIMRDSACEHSVIRKDLVPNSCYLPGRTVELKGIGGTVILPLAEVSLVSPVISGTVQVAVVEDLDHDMLLGHDLDTMCSEIISKQVYVMTRAQAQKEQQEFTQGEKELFEHIKQRNQIPDSHAKGISRDANNDNPVHEETLPVLDPQSSDDKITVSVTREKLVEKQRSDTTLVGIRERIVETKDIDKHKSMFL